MDGTKSGKRTSMVNSCQANMRIVIDRIVKMLFFIFGLFIELLIGHFSSQCFRFILLNQLQEVKYIFLGFGDCFIVNLTTFDTFGRQHAKCKNVFLFQYTNSLFRLLYGKTARSI